MPLEVLLGLVVGGITAIAVALHLLGLTGGAPLTRDQVTRAWRAHFPDDPAQQVDLLPDARTALVRTTQGRGLLWQMGADTVARYLDKADVQQTPKGLRVLFPDYGAPRVDISLGADQRAYWQKALHTS